MFGPFNHARQLDKAMNLTNRDGSPLMTVSDLRREGGRLIVVGSIMGAMPIEAVVTPSAMRSSFRLLSFGKILFLLSMFFRS